MSAPLYCLTGAFAEVQARVDAGEDVSELLEQLTGAVEDKTAALVRVLRDVELDSDKIAEELKRLSARKKAADANAARIREYMRGAMAAAGIARVKAATFAVTLSEGCERVEVLDEALVPETYVRVRREVNRAAVLDAWRTTGECVPGTAVTRGSKLTIR